MRGGVKHFALSTNFSYASPAEMAAALAVNFPAWGANCGRVGSALREQYGLTQHATAFSATSEVHRAWRSPIGFNQWQDGVVFLLQGQGTSEEAETAASDLGGC